MGASTLTAEVLDDAIRVLTASRVPGPYTVEVPPPMLYRFLRLYDKRQLRRARRQMGMSLREFKRLERAVRDETRGSRVESAVLPT